MLGVCVIWLAPHHVDPARLVDISLRHYVISGILPDLHTLQTRSCREQPQDITEERHC